VASQFAMCDAHSKRISLFPLLFKPQKAHISDISEESGTASLRRSSTLITCSRISMTSACAASCSLVASDDSPCCVHVQNCKYNQYIQFSRISFVRDMSDEGVWVFLCLMCRLKLERWNQRHGCYSTHAFNGKTCNQIF